MLWFSSPFSELVLLSDTDLLSEIQMRKEEKIVLKLTTSWSQFEFDHLLTPSTDLYAQTGYVKSLGFTLSFVRAVTIILRVTNLI